MVKFKRFLMSTYMLFVFLAAMFVMTGIESLTDMAFAAVQKNSAGEIILTTLLIGAVAYGMVRLALFCDDELRKRPHAVRLPSGRFITMWW